MTNDQAENVFRFEASARLQRLFGRELIPDDGSAIEELVKNAYDSNATEVTITLTRPTGEREGEIEIRDNGFGLSPREFGRVWMRAGYSEKTGQPLPETSRIQVGEKGIGRFAADKLGRHLVVLTKSRGARETLKVTFDWPRFEKGKRRLLSDIAIPYELVREELLSGRTSGTILRITKLRADWPDKAIEKLRQRLAGLLNPYDPEQAFRIVLKAPVRRLSGPIVPNEIRGANFEWEVTRASTGRVRIKRRRRIESSSTEWADWENLPAPAPEKLGDDRDFGPLRARFFFFVDRPKKANVGDTVPGVAVFRDGLKVEPAGSSESDWLGLLEKRAKRAGHMPLVPSRLFGFVEISREDNPHLQDATNRRAFIHGPQLDSFRDFLKARLDELEAQVEEEVAQPRWERSRQIKSQKLIQARHSTLSIMSLSLAHELRQPLQAIRLASGNIEEHLRQQGVAIEAVNAAAGVIRRSVDRIDRHIQFLKTLGSGREETELFDGVETANEVIGVFGDFAAARNTTVVSEGTPGSTVHGNRATTLAALTNLVLNALQAIEQQADEREHHVKIAVTTSDGHTIMRVIDDGPGIPEANRTRLFKRQTTSKQGGMGVGLIVWREALQMFDGDLECERFEGPTTFKITVPSRRNNGADSTG
jgi:signal transduction histidine kinase